TNGSSWWAAGGSATRRSASTPCAPATAWHSERQRFRPTTSPTRSTSCRSASMAKFVYVAPRLSLTGMSADEWIAARPGTEGTLALAMAQVIVSRHLARQPADASRLVGLLSGYAPSAVAEAIGIDQDTIVRLAREFASSGGGLAVAGGMATQYENGAAIVAAVNILNYVAGSVGSLVKFGADSAVGSAGTFADLVALKADMDAGRVAL